MNAHDIYNGVLKRYQLHIEQADYAGFADSIVPGFSFSTLNAQRTYTRHDDAAIGMRAVSEEMAQRGIWDLHRTC
ncbi:MAG: hypothetical protein AAGP08_14385, partial [Pseudomonadota bacterium]